MAEVNATLFGTATDRVVPTDTIINTMLDVGTGISDLIFSPGRPPQVERYGELVDGARSPSCRRCGRKTPRASPRI